MITKRQGTTCQLSQAEVVSKIFYVKGQGERGVRLGWKRWKPIDTDPISM